MDDHPAAISIGDVQRAVAHSFSLSLGEMLSRDRCRYPTRAPRGDVSEPRAGRRRHRRPPAVRGLVPAHRDGLCARPYQRDPCVQCDRAQAKGRCRLLTPRRSYSAGAGRRRVQARAGRLSIRSCRDAFGQKKSVRAKQVRNGDVASRDCRRSCFALPLEWKEKGAGPQANRQPER